jgi:hypothetical protein
MPTGTPGVAMCASATDRGRVDRTHRLSMSWLVEGSPGHTSSTPQATSVTTSDEEPEYRDKVWTDRTRSGQGTLK